MSSVSIRGLFRDREDICPGRWNLRGAKFLIVLKRLLSFITFYIIFKFLEIFQLFYMHNFSFETQKRLQKNSYNLNPCLKNLIETFKYSSKHFRINGNPLLQITRDFIIKKDLANIYSNFLKLNLCSTQTKTELHRNSNRAAPEQLWGYLKTSLQSFLYTKLPWVSYGAAA